MQWVGEKLQAPDGQAGGSEVRLLGRCQELQALLQEKGEAVVLLEQQLEEQVWGLKTCCEGPPREPC